MTSSVEYRASWAAGRASAPSSSAAARSLGLWTAEPEHDERKKAGIKIMAGLTLAAIAAGWYKRFLWSPLKSRKISFH